jgi:hypothetical protein
VTWLCAAAKMALSLVSLSQPEESLNTPTAHPRGRESGETSWLARRIGQLPEAGQPRPTPWVHNDVLALIARDGLGISPREVEAWPTPSP